MAGGGGGLGGVSGGSWSQIAVGALEVTSVVLVVAGLGMALCDAGIWRGSELPLGLQEGEGVPAARPGGGHGHLCPSGHGGGSCVLADRLSLMREGAAGLNEARRNAAALSLLPLPCGMPVAS